jgi:flagellar motor protein MotB
VAVRVNRSRPVEAFHHTPNALKELLERDPETALEKLEAMPHDVGVAPDGEGTRLAFTEQVAFFEEADGSAVRERGWRALLESLGAEIRRSTPGRPR